MHIFVNLHHTMLKLLGCNLLYVHILPGTHFAFVFASKTRSKPQSKQGTFWVPGIGSGPKLGRVLGTVAVRFKVDSA